jgi:Tfp pilus assembly protein PilV
MRHARGFSLVECVVAAALCAAGLLAVAATSRATLALGLLGHRTASAAQIAASRLALVRAMACDAGAGTAGADSSDAYTTSWSVQGSGRARTLEVAVRFGAAGRERMQRYEVVVSCAP